jgi:hypothetical protein
LASEKQPSFQFPEDTAHLRSAGISKTPLAQGSAEEKRSPRRPSEGLNDFAWMIRDPNSSASHQKANIASPKWGELNPLASQRRLPKHLIFEKQNKNRVVDATD